MEVMTKVIKLNDLIKTKFLMKFNQKIYIGDKYNINYLLQTNLLSKDILIVFTSCTKPGQKARYNYIKTLDKFKCNKLFILDDFGFDNRGAYYLGKNNDFDIEKDVNSLISYIINKFNIEKKIFIGSSKGGYAALYFGLPFKNSIIITGAPQYMLGNYLSIPNHNKILEYIMGDIGVNSINKLNSLMENKLKLYKENNNTIYLHYSKQEETYISDISLLVKELENLNYKVFYDIEDYKTHSELTKFFPDFIKNILINNIKV